MKIKYKQLVNHEDGFKYELLEDYVYYSRTFNRYKTLKQGMLSDGATGARDLGAEGITWARRLWTKALSSFLRTRFGVYLTLDRNEITAAWWVHDAFCNEPRWDDGEPVSNFIASTILAAILYTDRYYVESVLWWFATFVFGGQTIKKEVGWIFTK